MLYKMYVVSLFSSSMPEFAMYIQMHSDNVAETLLLSSFMKLAPGDECVRTSTSTVVVLSSLMVFPGSCGVEVLTVAVLEMTPADVATTSTEIVRTEPAARIPRLQFKALPVLVAVCRQQGQHTYMHHHVTH